MASARLTLCLLAALCCASVSAREEVNDAVQRQARDHYKRGIMHYNLGEFDAAIGEFKNAYGLTHAPRLLFDIAQAQRLKKDYEQALYSYTTYLRLQPDAPNRVDVAARITEMSRLLGAERAAAEKAAAEKAAEQIAAQRAAAEKTAAEKAAAVKTVAAMTPSPAPVVAPVPPPPPNPRPARVELYAGIGVLAAGVAVLAGAAGCTAAAASDGTELRNVQQAGGPWTQHDANVYDEARNYQTAAAALWAVGGAAVVVGGVVAILGARKLHRTRFSIAPSRSGASVMVSGALP